MASEAIRNVAGENTYINLQTFENINQLDETVRSYKEKYKIVLNKSTLKVLNLLHNYSAKYTGVSYMTKNTIARVLGMSRRTVIRCTEALEKLGIIKQHSMKRLKDMMQTSNAIVIQPLVDEEQVAEEVALQSIADEKEEVHVESVTQEKPKVSHHESNISLKQNKKININTVNNEKIIQDKIIYDLYIEFSKNGINKTLFHKVLKEVTGKKGILNFKAYLRGALQKVMHHKQYKTGNLTYGSARSQQFYDSLNSDRKTERDQQDFSMRLIGNQGVVHKSLRSDELNALGVF